MMSLEKDKGYDSPSLIQSNMPSIATRKTWPLHAASMGRGTSNTQASVSTGEWLETLDTTVTLLASHKNSCTQVDFTEVDFSEVTPPKDGFGKVSSLEPCSSHVPLKKASLRSASLRTPIKHASLRSAPLRLASLKSATMYGWEFIQLFQVSVPSLSSSRWNGVAIGIPSFWVRWACVAYALARLLTRNHCAGKDMQHALA